MRRLSRRQKAFEAKAFIRRFYRENQLPEEEMQQRVAEVLQSLKTTGHYDHTSQELAFGARCAWRNHARCIGRLFWESLEVTDARDVDDDDKMMDIIFSNHRAALNKGRIQSRITIFPPATVDRLPSYIESKQITLYAGYQAEDGTVIGDRDNLEQTRICSSLGWQPPKDRGQFDILPVVVRTATGERKIYEVPDNCFTEVDIVHDDYPTLAELGLKWYAVPSISGMIMSIGGIEYPCAPFNGFYMCTEIASRNFADVRRYNLLPQVAEACGIDAQSDPLWRDRALTELNHAVLSSFQAAQVTMVDHHKASEQYIEFERRERSEGRDPPADWMWITPPQASAACPVFHLPMRDRAVVPNYYYSRATDARWMEPDFEDEEVSRNFIRMNNLRRRYYRWRQRQNWIDRWEPWFSR